MKGKAVGSIVKRWVRNSARDRGKVGGKTVSLGWREKDKKRLKDDRKGKKVFLK